MNRQLDILIEIARFEWRVQRRNPVWMISLAAAALLGFSEAFSSGVLDWPTMTQAVRAYQLGCTMILGIMTFLLVAGTVARDLSADRQDLLLCRPIHSWAYIAGAYLGNILFALGVSVVYMATFLAIPLFYGQSSPYPVREFACVWMFAVLPTILACGALAMLLMCVSRRVIVALPVFLVYFLAVALFHIPNALRTNEPAVDMWDLSMRLEARDLSAWVGPCRLWDMSYSGLLHPLAPQLCVRAILYTALSVVFVCLSVLLLENKRSH
jgi:ABC-type transport system involved in multi-copper enzyme maturation permease subunit